MCILFCHNHFYANKHSVFSFLIIIKSFARKNLVIIVSTTSRFLLKVLNIVVEYKIPNTFINNDNYLIVSNHLSYLDVIILAAKFPSCFVTSTDVKKTPFLGHLTRLAGCLFVDRNNRKNLKLEIVEIRTALSEGMNVIFSQKRHQRMEKRFSGFADHFLKRQLQLKRKSSL